MADLQKQQEALKHATQTTSDSRDTLHRARQDLERLRRQQQQSLRSTGTRDDDPFADRIRELEETVRSSRESLADALRGESRILLEDVDLWDPRRTLSSLDDLTPILMMPLRLETRFRLSQPEPELWVRVFPDDWAVDGFHSRPSETELKNAIQFWADYWAAAGERAGRVGAWRSLTASHGAGRAGWLVRNYEPLDPSEEPERVAPAQLFLVITAHALPPESERNAVADYWIRVWRAPDDPTEEAAARSDLVDATDAATADSLIERFEPKNLDDVPPLGFDRPSTDLSAVWLELPDPATIDADTGSWTEPPRVQTLPERLVLVLRVNDTERSVIGNVISTSIALGPDPSADPDEQLRKEDGELVYGDELAWMFEFDTAVRDGLAFRVPLTPAEAASGFDRVTVLGVNLRETAEEAQLQLEQLIQHHHDSSQGFALVPQGAPTNNSASIESDYTFHDDVEASFDRHFGDPFDFSETDPTRKLDGQWFAEMLGIDSSVLGRAAYADGRDQCEIRAMNAVLWPATAGYTMETMLDGVFSDTTRVRTRELFKDHVIPRGIIPAFRVGDQPYGVLPTTQWSNMQWFRKDRDDRYIRSATWFNYDSFLDRYYRLLKKIDEDWDPLMALVPHVFKSGDAHQVLLDTVGLHGGSAEIHQRWAHSVEYFQNLFNAQGSWPALEDWLEAELYGTSGWLLLQSLGHQGDDRPELLEHVFIEDADPVSGPLVDDVDLDEDQPLRVYTTDGRNYLEWLRDTAATSLDNLRSQTDFIDEAPPRALLYRLVRHALQLGYWQAALRYNELAINPQMNSVAIAAARREPRSLNISADPEIDGTSRYEMLYSPAPNITGNDDKLMMHHIRDNLFTATESRDLSVQLRALEHLLHTPTARLQRLMSEHLDACTYRLDAWKQALVHVQVQRMRALSSGETRSGIYLGAFGWLEDLRPKTEPLRPARVGGEVSNRFKFGNDLPLHDPSNQGFIHAPSLNHAVTASVLRNGYISSADPEIVEALKVNLSSRRVRQALSVIEGVRNDQSLGEMLGYQLERALHENFQLAETDEFIYAFRREYPLVGNHFDSTRHEFQPGESIDSIEARNVVDGLALAQHVDGLTNKTYPFDLPDMPTADGSQAGKINQAVEDMRNTRDAVSDLAMAEALHQATKGNVENAAANLDAYGRADMPPLPEIVQTPRQGIALTHRVVWTFDTSPPAGSPWPAVPLTARAEAEPILNHWLATLVPQPDEIVCAVQRTDTDVVFQVDVVQLGLQPIDLLFLLRVGDGQSELEIEERILAAARTAEGPLRPSDSFRILHTNEAQAPGTTTLFELTPLMRSLRRILLQSRSLKPTDLAMQHEAKDSPNANGTIDRARLQTLRDALDTRRLPLSTFLGSLETLLADTEANREVLIGGLNARMVDLTTQATTASSLGVEEADFGFAPPIRQRIYVMLDELLDENLDRWSEKRDEFTGYLAQYDALPTSATPSQRFAALQRCERAVSTIVTTPLPDDPDTYRTIVVNRRNDFETRFNEMQAARTSSAEDPFAYLNAVRTLLPTDDFDPTPMTVTAVEDELLNRNSELARMSTALLAALDKRISAIDAALATHDAATTGDAMIAALAEGFNIAFGDGFVVMPQFGFPIGQATELGNAHNDRTHILRHLEADLSRKRALDEWFYGTARVREKMAEWEYVAVAAEPLGSTTFDLSAWQLPYQPDDFWLGAEFPETYSIDGERLLITGYHANGFNAAASQAGLLLDEWTEVIPSPDVTTGVAFHFDRPNSEPPQACLLVTPTDFRGGWLWSDLLNAVSETLDQAKRRAIEPEQIDTTAYSVLLPATSAATTRWNTSIGLNVAEVNGVQLSQDFEL